MKVADEAKAAAKIARDEERKAKRAGKAPPRKKRKVAATAVSV